VLALSEGFTVRVAAPDDETVVESEIVALAAVVGDVLPEYVMIGVGDGEFDVEMDGDTDLEPQGVAELDDERDSVPVRAGDDDAVVEIVCDFVKLGDGEPEPVGVVDERPVLLTVRDAPPDAEFCDAVAEGDSDRVSRSQSVVEPRADGEMPDADRDADGDLDDDTVADDDADCDGDVVDEREMAALADGEDEIDGEKETLGEALVVGDDDGAADTVAGRPDQLQPLEAKGAAARPRYT